MNATKTAVLLLAGVALLGMPAALCADPVDGFMDYDGVGVYKTRVWVHYAPSPYDGQSIWAGQHRVNYHEDSYVGYCVDIFEPAGDDEVMELSPLQVSGGDMAACLFETYADSVGSGRDAGGLQSAILEVLYEDPANGYDVTSGTFSISNNSGAISAANALLASLPASHIPLPSTVILHSDGQADLMISDDSQVPEPGALALLALGALVAVLHRRSLASC
jgi:hypothetical protein